MTIIEVEPKGFWHGSLFYSVDTEGYSVILNRKEYDQMLTNWQVIVLGE